MKSKQGYVSPLLDIVIMNETDILTISDGVNNFAGWGNTWGTGEEGDGL